MRVMRCRCVDPRRCNLPPFGANRLTRSRRAGRAIAVEPACAKEITEDRYAGTVDGSPDYAAQFMTGQKMRGTYRLPAGVECEHCVLQWWWVTANSCLPPGYRDRDWPSTFGGCSGDGPGMGWWGPTLNDCGAQYPEEVCQRGPLKLWPPRSTAA